MIKQLRRPRCRWCGVELRPHYRRECIDCHHSDYQHPLVGASVQHCGKDDCQCTKRGVTYFNHLLGEELARTKKYRDQQFPKVLKGYGKDEAGKFCTFSCALAWANKYAT